jgi:hypothetical protein
LIAVKHGIYFDSSSDCSCCGPRWGEASKYDAFEYENISWEAGEFAWLYEGVDYAIAITKGNVNE